jgi:hypothetical protein
MLNSFIENAKGLARNPLGIIALFISLIYGFACLVLGFNLSNLSNLKEMVSLIWFIIIFPFFILGVFTYLVVCHHKKLYGPSDYKDEQNFVSTFIRDKDVPSDLEKVNIELRTLASEKKEKGDQNLVEKINKISEKIEKIKEKSEKIPINNLWRLNHWGGSCASIIGDKMIFAGTSVPKETDGSHIDLNNMLEIGKSYEISCFVKSDPRTNGMFQLWCHDNTGVKPAGVNVSTDFKIPSVDGEQLKLIFRASYNKNVRIHLQYKPGQGRIEVGDVRISER